MAACYAAMHIIKKKRKSESLIKNLLKDYQNPFNLEESVFKEKFGFDQNAVIYVHDLLAPIMKRPLGYPVVLQILTSLQIMRSGCFQNNAEMFEMFHMSQATLSRSMDAFLDAILDVSPNIIQFPSPSELFFVETKYYDQSKIPNIIGVITCFPIYINKPRATGEEVIPSHRGEKYSLNVQMVCDADLRILDIVAHWPGTTPNSEVWKHSAIRNCLKNNTTPTTHMMRNFLIGNSSFPLEPWLMVPYEDCQITEELIFNDHVNRALNVGKSCLNALKSRFRCLIYESRPLYYSPEKSSKIIMTCMVLHNLGLKLNQSFEQCEVVEDVFIPEIYCDSELDMEGTLLRNEAMAIRDEIAKQLSST